MPGDRLRQRTRWGLFTRHSGTYETGLSSVGSLGLALNLNRVSDNDYWRDFNGRGMPLTTRLLASDGGLSWGRGDWSVNLRALKWQTLQDVTAPIVPPYDRLPQQCALGPHERRRAGLFGRPRCDALSRRLVLDRAAQRRPRVRACPAVAPGAAALGLLHAQGAAARQPLPVRPSAGRRPHRGGPRAAHLSLDSGLVFERDARYFGRAFTQTLEPRLKYVYTPYRDQNGLPNYDSGLYDFNFATIWADNIFAGNDRIVDNNLITAGLTSRLLDPQTGAEALRLSVAQRYRFTPQQVVLPGGAPSDKGLSDLMLGAGITWDPHWAFDSVVQYNRETNRSTRTTVQARYSPGPFRTLSAAYRLQRDLANESVDVGWQWPLGGGPGGRGELGTTRQGGGSCSGRWYSVGR
jgi:LPS-assembly protein